MLERQSLLSSGHSLLIREAKTSDAATIIKYVRQISGESEYLTMTPGEFQMTVEAEEQFLLRYLHIENKIFLVALCDGELAGTLHFAGGLRQRVEHTGMMGISVQKKFWGIGVGSTLMDSLLGWARQSGLIAKIDLQVREDNERAIRLYQSKGFQVEGTIRRAVQVNGRFYSHLYMGLEL